MLAHHKRKLAIEICISIALLILFLIMVINMPKWVIETLPATVKPTFFPRVVSGTLAGLSLLLLFTTIIDYRKAATSLARNKEEQFEPVQNDSQYSSFIIYVTVLFLYLLGMKYLGFLLSTPFAMFAVAVQLGLRKYMIGFISYVMVAFALNYVAFNYMQIMLPSGLLWE